MGGLWEDDEEEFGRQFRRSLDHAMPLLKGVITSKLVKGIKHLRSTLSDREFVATAVKLAEIGMFNDLQPSLDLSSYVNRVDEFITEDVMTSMAGSQDDNSCDACYVRYVVVCAMFDRVERNQEPLLLVENFIRPRDVVRALTARALGEARCTGP